MLRDAIDEAGLLIKAYFAEALGTSKGRYPDHLSNLRGSGRWDEDFRNQYHRVSRRAQRDRRGQSGVNWSHAQAMRGKLARGV